MRIKDRNGVTREDNDDYVLQDGETLTTELQFMDAAHRTVTTDAPAMLPDADRAFCTATVARTWPRR